MEGRGSCEKQVKSRQTSSRFRLFHFNHSSAIHQCRAPPSPPLHRYMLSEPDSEVNSGAAASNESFAKSTVILYRNNSRRGCGELHACLAAGGGSALQRLLAAGEVAQNERFDDGGSMGVSLYGPIELACAFLWRLFSWRHLQFFSRSSGICAHCGARRME